MRRSLALIGRGDADEPTGSPLSPSDCRGFPVPDRIRSSTDIGKESSRNAPDDQSPVPYIRQSRQSLKPDRLRITPLAPYAILDSVPCISRQAAVLDARIAARCAADVVGAGDEIPYARRKRKLREPLPYG